MMREVTKLLIGVILLSASVLPVRSQYAVRGGSALLAESNAANRIDVYLVFGTEGVTLSYTSSSSGHQWYRYRTRALDYEAIESERVGNTSTVRSVSEGYGYFVMEGDNLSSSRFIWIIDYSFYPVVIRDVGVEAGVDPCMALRLSGEDASQPLTYRIPLGDQVVIPRSYEVSYLTQIWNERLTAYESVLQLDTLRGSPLHESLTPPLTDTEVEVAGDLFARHFGVEQVFRIDSYTASALDVRTDTTIVSRSTSNIDVESELLAPCEVRFTAYANTPVASLFIWQIVRSESPDIALVRFTEPEISYMFDRVGEYDITLEVSDRLGLCVNTDHSYHISVTETQVLIPNAFSPGVSIGVNDVFKIAYRSVVRFQGQIFNRWGAELYRWSDPVGGWDGKYRGSYVPAGTYFYIIEYTGTDGRFHRRSGDVTVIRSTKTSTKVEQ